MASALRKVLAATPLLFLRQHLSPLGASKDIAQSCGLSLEIRAHRNRIGVSSRSRLIRPRRIPFHQDIAKATLKGQSKGRRPPMLKRCEDSIQKESVPRKHKKHRQASKAQSSKNLQRISNGRKRRSHSRSNSRSSLRRIRNANRQFPRRRRRPTRRRRQRKFVQQVEEQSDQASQLIPTIALLSALNRTSTCTPPPSPPSGSQPIPSVSQPIPHASAGAFDCSMRGNLRLRGGNGDIPPNDDLSEPPETVSGEVPGQVSEEVSEEVSGRAPKQADETEKEEDDLKMETQPQHLEASEANEDTPTASETSTMHPSLQQAFAKALELTETWEKVQNSMDEHIEAEEWTEELEKRVLLTLAIAKGARKKNLKLRSLAAWGESLGLAIPLSLADWQQKSEKKESEFWEKAGQLVAEISKNTQKLLEMCSVDLNESPQALSISREKRKEVDAREVFVRKVYQLVGDEVVNDENLLSVTESLRSMARQLADLGTQLNPDIVSPILAIMRKETFEIEETRRNKNEQIQNPVLSEA